MNCVEPPRRPRVFASDNNAGICPEAWEAMARSNRDHAPGYGDDPWTSRACGALRDLFEADCEVFLVFNGTAANALSLAAICRPYHAILCHALAHIQHDECGAPEFFSGGAKLLPLAGEHGRLDPAVVDAAIRGHFPLHASKPGALSLTQATECGTTYPVAQIAELCRVAHHHGLRVHLDGARLANALAFLEISPRQLIAQSGIDVVSFGLTKNGGYVTEAIVVFEPSLAKELDYRIKQAGQLASKMRHMAAAWTGLLESGAWIQHARHANAMAQQLAGLLTMLPGVRLLHPTEANAVFVDLPESVIAGLRERGWRFYVFEGDTGCRLMCSWDTTPQDLADFAADTRLLIAGPGPT